MAACFGRVDLPPDYVCVPRKLHRVAFNWSLSDLDKIIWALERDDMLSAEDINKILPSKKTEEIEQLISLCLSNDEADFGTDMKLEQISSEESALEILKNGLRAVVPPQFSPTFAVLSVLESIIKNECSEDSESKFLGKRLSGHRGLISPNYARIYGFLSDLFTFSNHRHNIEESDVVVLLDMLFCLLQATDYLLTNDLSSDVKQIFSDVQDKVGALLSSISASYHHRCAFLKRISVSPIYEIESLVASFHHDTATSSHVRTNILPFTAPMFVIKEAKFSPDVSHAVLRKKLMRNLFEQSWKLPLSNQDVDIQKVQKELTRFIMNPFSIKTAGVSTVCGYFATLNMLMCYYEECITSRVIPSNSLLTCEPHIVRNTLIQSATKLIAAYQSHKNNLVRRASLPVDRREIDKYISAVHVPKSDAQLAALRAKHSGLGLRPTNAKGETSVPRPRLKTLKAKKTPSRPPKLYRRVD